MAGGQRSTISSSLSKAGQELGNRARKAPRRTYLLVLATATLGLAGGIGALNLVWAQADPERTGAHQAGERARLSPPPTRPITVLLIGSDADLLGQARNGAAPSGPANSDALLLARVDPAGALRLLILPADLAVQLPGEKPPQSLGSLYREGGPALASSSVAALLGLESGQPQRYVVVPRAALRSLVDGLGGVEMNLEQPLRSTDKTQNFEVDLQAGLQNFRGNQVEQMVRFLEPSLGEQGRRIRQQLVLEGLFQQLSRPEQGSRLPELLTQLAPQVDTNLSTGEALSLLSAATANPKQIRFDQLPLARPSKADQPLRQLQKSAAVPLWPKG
ncbi:LCP family protein [Synechococcus sp. CS-602]|uniref:LCP family protein n=1 Tax=Synechococcaceae TaxID=1890426 RepID=UPI0009F9DBF8|nr:MULTISPECIES: LCP family protein [Synechococcaceae]MCT4364452.1 LCP family protein [Candidatus Regnicoccus frigidus MAG-AL1]MCT0202744.1 LCP family protein [Synechococcus sp. CS-603]MCT0203660.1 LCP family protein [Synechococcus sp. CS-602]MCT0246100.1 LCP family protein [Synechococcus sp. CS-601]MCT4366197.1 LCP family protein [Candidatus Regnicoccus frigidus MAG-AL2]